MDTSSVKERGLNKVPGSHLGGKPITSEWLENHKEIKTIVDLGPGAATYPKLMGGDYIWKAVEIWGPYVEKFELNKYYQEIRIGDIRYMEFPDGDCCIAGDILEHLTRPDFIKTFHKIDDKFKYVVISVPIHLLSDDVFEGNPFESHQSYWSVEELEEVFGPKYKKVMPTIEDDPCVIFFKE